MMTTGNLRFVAAEKTVTASGLAAALNIDITTLPERERIIEKGLQSFIEVGAALAAIQRDQQYVVGDYTTFAEYLRGRWGMSKSRGYQLIDAAESYATLQESTMVDAVRAVLPTNERQVRPLTSLPKDSQAKAWMEVIKEAPRDKDNRPVVTEHLVQSVVEKRRPRALPKRVAESRTATATVPAEPEPTGLDQLAVESCEEFVEMLAHCKTGLHMLQGEAMGQFSPKQCATLFLKIQRILARLMELPTNRFGDSRGFPGRR